jgi:hypothetical protein
VLFNFTLEYAIRKVHGNQEGLKFGYIRFWPMLMTLIFWEKKYIPYRKTQDTLEASKGVGLEVNPD